MLAVLTENQKIALWFVRVRWGAILTMLLVVLYNQFIGQIHVAFIPCLLILVIASAYNILFPALIRRFPAFSSNQIFTYLRMLTDILVVTLMIHFTGGTESPFALLYIIEIAAVAIFGFMALAYLMSAHAALLYSITCHLEAVGRITHYRSIDAPGTLYLNLYYVYSRAISIFFISCLMAYLASYLTDRLRDKQKEIEELSASRLDFMNMVVHELRTPLTTIKEYLSLCTEGALGVINEKQKEVLGILTRQSDRLTALTGDLLNLARIDSGIGKFEKRTFSLANLADEALVELAPQTTEKKIQVVKLYAADLPPVLADHDKMLEVMINLLANSLKFSNDGGKLYLSIGSEPGRIKVSIRDEGRGISPDDLPNIFRKFYRSAQTDSKFKGTGLGLSIARSIIERHGGQIWADSPGLGQGATFTFTLPHK
jgi:signal transduction histidine kinase